jgi:hypothetical protein
MLYEITEGIRRQYDRAQWKEMRRQNDVRDENYIETRKA